MISVSSKTQEKEAGSLARTDAEEEGTEDKLPF